MRTERDATLAMPRLLLPSVQVNMNAGRVPFTEADGQVYLNRSEDYDGRNDERRGNDVGHGADRASSHCTSWLRNRGTGEVSVQKMKRPMLGGSTLDG